MKSVSFRITADRTEQVELKFSTQDSLVSKDFPYEQMQALIRYVVASCPNLKTFRLG